VSTSGDRICIAIPNLEKWWELLCVARASSSPTATGQVWEVFNRLSESHFWKILVHETSMQETNDVSTALLRDGSFLPSQTTLVQKSC